MAEKICFGQSNLETCVALEPVTIEAASRIKDYNALECAKKAETLDGLNIMACNTTRHCQLYHSDMNDTMLQKIINLHSDDVVPVDIWFSSYLKIRTSFDYSSIFFLSADKKLLKYDNEYAHYIGEGEHILSEREEYILKISENILTEIKRNPEFKSTRPVNNTETKENAQTSDPISFETEIWAHDPFVTPSQTQLFSSDDEILAHLNSWMAGQHSNFISSCIEDNAFYYSPTTSYSNNRSIYATYSDHSITLFASLLPELLKHTEQFDSTMFHECLHWDFDRYAIWDEPAAIMIAAIDLANSMLLAAGIKENRASSLLEQYQDTLSKDWQDMGNELRAYLCEPVPNEDYIKGLFSHLVWRYSSDAAVYILDWLTNLMKADTDLTDEQYATARSHIETFNIFIRGYKIFESAKLPATPFEMQASVWWINQFMSFPNDNIRSFLQGTLKYYYLSTR